MTTKQIQDQIEAGKSLKMLTQAYTEIASIKLKRIRSQVERTRYFFNDISQIYRVVKAWAAQKKISTKTATDLKPSVSVLITSNYRFYGSINNELLKYFLVKSAKYPTDRIVIGKMGLEYLKTIKYFHPYKAMVLQKDLPNYQELRDLVQEIKQYKQIVVYYTELKSVLVQIPTQRDINESQAEEGIKSLMTDTNSLMEDLSNFEFIFEPEIEKMLEFFEGQMASVLLEQCFLEAELSRTASRLTSMNRGQMNALKFLNDEEKLLRSSQKQLENARLLETVGSLLRLRKEADAQY